MTWRTIPAAFPPARAVSLSVEPALKNVICPTRLSLLQSASAISWREYRRAFCIYGRAPLRGPSAGPSRESIADIMQVSSKSQRPTTPQLIAEKTAAQRHAPPCPRRLVWRLDPRCGIWPLAPRERRDLRPGAAPPLSRHTKPLRCRNRGRAEAKPTQYKVTRSAECCRLFL